MLENINLLLYSILIWIKKPWTLSCLNFYNEISSFSVAKLNYITFLVHVIFLCSSVHLYFLSSLSRMTFSPFSASCYFPHWYVSSHSHIHLLIPFTLHCSYNVVEAPVNVCEWPCLHCGILHVSDFWISL